MVVKVLLEHVGVEREHLDHGLGEPLHVALPNLRILTLHLLQHLETLRQLREHIHHRVREVRVLGVLLKLQAEKGNFSWGQEGETTMLTRS